MVDRDGTTLRTSLVAGLIALATVDQTLARHDVSGAVATWQDAYGATLASRGSEGMIAVGDEFIRIGDEAVAAQCFRVADQLAARGPRS